MSDNFAAGKLTAKLVVIDTIVRTMVVENLLETDNPIANMRDYASRVEASLTTAAGGDTTLPGMMLQSEIVEQFAVIEKWLRQAGAQ